MSYLEYVLHSNQKEWLEEQWHEFEDRNRFTLREFGLLSILLVYALLEYLIELLSFSDDFIVLEEMEQLDFWDLWLALINLLPQLHNQLLVALNRVPHLKILHLLLDLPLLSTLLNWNGGGMSLTYLSAVKLRHLSHFTHSSNMSLVLHRLLRLMLLDSVAMEWFIIWLNMLLQQCYELFHVSQSQVVQKDWLEEGKIDRGAVVVFEVGWLDGGGVEDWFLVGGDAENNHLLEEILKRDIELRWLATVVCFLVVSKHVLYQLCHFML